LNSLLRVVSEYTVHNGSAIRLFLFGKWLMLTRTTTLRRLAQARYQYVGHSLGVGLPNAAASAPFDLMHRRLCSGSRLSRTLEKGEVTRGGRTRVHHLHITGVEASFVAQADGLKRSSLPVYQAARHRFPRG